MRAAMSTSTFKNLPEMLLDRVAKTPDEIQRRTRAFEDAGCAELVWLPCSADPRQVEMLSDALGAPVD